MEMKTLTPADLEGIFIGNAQDTDACTGITVILAPEGAVCGVDVRGGAPATRETDLLKSEKMVDRVHGVFLSGGSAYGLDAAGGIMDFLERRRIGFDVGIGVVPIVTGACLFDLAFGRSDIRPDKAMGRAACEHAFARETLREGNYGAGTGATVGKIASPARMMKGGLGICGLQWGGLKVLAVMAVNTLGDVVGCDDGRQLAGLLSEDGSRMISSSEAILDLALGQQQTLNPFTTNTTIGCVITNARMDKAQANMLASLAHDGLARTLRPSHTRNDGDTIFALSCGTRDFEPMSVGILAAEAVARAVNRGVLCAAPVRGLKCARDFMDKAE